MKEWEVSHPFVGLLKKHIGESTPWIFAIMLNSGQDDHAIMLIDAISTLYCLLEVMKLKRIILNLDLYYIILHRSDFLN